MSSFVEGFLKGCADQGLSPDQTARAVKAACAQPEARAEFEKDAIWGALARGAAMLAPGLLPDMSPASLSGKPNDTIDEIGKFGVGPAQLYSMVRHGPTVVQNAFNKATSVNPGLGGAVGIARSIGSPAASQAPQPTAQPVQKQAFAPAIGRLLGAIGGRALGAGVGRSGVLGRALSGAGQALNRAGSVMGRAPVKATPTLVGTPIPVAKQMVRGAGGNALPADLSGFARGGGSSAAHHQAVSGGTFSPSAVKSPGFWSNWGPTMAMIGLPVGAELAMGGMGQGQSPNQAPDLAATPLDAAKTAGVLHIAKTLLSPGTYDEDSDSYQSSFEPDLKGMFKGIKRPFVGNKKPSPKPAPANPFDKVGGVPPVEAHRAPRVQNPFALGR